MQTISIVLRGMQGSTWKHKKGKKEDKRKEGTNK
jgi:hypothetical protein